MFLSDTTCLPKLFLNFFEKAVTLAVSKTRSRNLAAKSKVTRYKLFHFVVRAPTLSAPPMLRLIVFDASKSATIAGLTILV
jgi:hypothetical protein